MTASIVSIRQRQGDLHVPAAQQLLQLLRRHVLDPPQPGKIPGVGRVIDDKGIALIEDQGPAWVVICSLLAGRSVPKGPTFSILP